MRERGLDCKAVAEVEVRLRACIGGHRSLFETCKTMLRGAEPSVVVVTVDRQATELPSAHGLAVVIFRAALPDRRWLPRLGVTVAAITQDIAREYGLSDDVAGLIVAAVAEDGPAAAKGIRAGDVIVEIDQDEITSPAEVGPLLDSAGHAGRALLLLYRRGEEFLFAVLRVE